MNVPEEEFECPICFEYMLEEISMCNNGHNICKYCKECMKPKKCPICRTHFIEGRNFALEKIVRNTYLTCKNDGCHMKIQGKHMLDHYLECSYGKTSCILYHTGCKWKGKISTLKKHINKKHRETINVWVDHGTFYSYLTFRFGDLFVLYLKNEGGIQHVAAMKMGFTNEEADTFKFLLEYNDKINRGYELYIGGPCIPKCYFHQIFSGDGVEIPLKMVRRLQKETDIDIVVKIERWDDPID